MVCVDTDFLIDLLRLDQRARNKLDSLIREGMELSTTPINACELFRGAYVSKNPSQVVQNVKGLVERLRLLDFDAEVAETYGRIYSQMRAKGVDIGDMDTLIASIALAHNEVLLTKNRKHFEKVPGLVVDSW